MNNFDIELLQNELDTIQNAIIKINKEIESNTLSLEDTTKKFDLLWEIYLPRRDKIIENAKKIGLKLKL